jgi:pilus assembly protein CpaC
MQAGQTMAIAGLLYNREESENHGLPWISEVPYLGIPFRHVSNISNEIELLVLVTPELVEPMDASEVPQCGPGMNSGTPNDWELFVKGHLEVPNCCPADNPNTPPTDGMIGPEQVPTPQSTGAMTPVNRPNFRSNPTTSTAQVAQRSSGVNGQNRYNSSKPNRGAGDSRNGESNTPPPFVGPVGYDVIK